MPRLTSWGILALMLCALVPARAQNATYTPPHPRLSPHTTVSTLIGGDRIIIVYGQPHTANPHNGKVRTVWGGDLVPLHEIWRTGADEATLLITEKALRLGADDTVTLPPGIYSLYTYPESLDSVKLVVNRQYGQWGLEYRADQDIARLRMQKATLEPPLHQFTIAITKTGSDAGEIRLLWENLQYSLPFTVVP